MVLPFSVPIIRNNDGKVPFHRTATTPSKTTSGQVGASGVLISLKTGTTLRAGELVSYTYALIRQGPVITQAIVAAIPDQVPDVLRDTLLRPPLPAQVRKSPPTRLMLKAHIRRTLMRPVQVRRSPSHVPQTLAVMATTRRVPQTRTMALNTVFSETGLFSDPRHSFMLNAKATVRLLSGQATLTTLMEGLLPNRDMFDKLVRQTFLFVLEDVFLSTRP